MGDLNFTTTEGFPSDSRISSTISKFVDDISSRVSRQKIKKLIFSQKSLHPSEINVGFKPEAYTRHNLVHPLLSAAGLEFQPEPRGGRERDTYPDFIITNTIVPILGEVKPVNRLSEGEEQLKRDINSDVFNASYGILTDGIEWRIYTTVGSEELSSIRTAKDTVSLRDELKATAFDEGVIQMDPGKYTRLNGPNQVEEFLLTFHQDRMNTWIFSQIPDEKRHEYTGNDRSVQLSLDDLSNEDHERK
jgi:hypothetical protein